MKFTIYKEQDKEPKEKEVCLRIIDDFGTFYVVACDPKTGVKVNRGYLIEFMPDGTISRPSSVNESLGFTLERYGSIKDSTS